MPQLIAILDANALWPISLCDVLLRAAEADLYQPKWSKGILDELLTSLIRQRPDLDPERIRARVEDMRDTFPEAMVSGYEGLIPAMLNDPKDRHVLAAAVRANAAVIVTDNVSDFPSAACEPYEIEVQTADEFLCHLWHLDPMAMAQVLRNAAADLKNPPKTPEEVTGTLGRMCPTFARTVVESGVLL